MKKKYPIVLTIAGSDSGGGAGIQADIKAICATGSYAASAVTAVTVQNTLGVEAVHPVPVDIISAQIRSVISDMGVDAVKIGMLHSSETVIAVKDALQEFQIRNVVLDPVMVSTSGHRLIQQDAVEVLAKELIPYARIITPNVPEAEILSGMKINSVEDLPAVAKSLSMGGRLSVLLKAGHLDSDVMSDVLYDAEQDRLLEIGAPRVDTVNTHGTGCTLSSAIASFLARGLNLEDAVVSAKDYVTKAIESGACYEIGHGHGPLNHFML